MSTFAEGYYSMGKEEGISIGLVEGKNIGRMEGKLLGLSQVALNMHQQGIDMETICKWTNLTMKEVLSLIEESDHDLLEKS